MSRVDHRAEHRLGEVRRHRRRLHDRRHAGEQRRRQLLEHAPHGEVERVDVHGDALQRHADVPADERPALRQRLRRPVDVETLIRKVSSPARRVGEERADAALDVDPRILLRRARRGGDEIELVLARHEVLRHRLQHQRALVEREPPERRAADALRVVDHRREVDPARRRLGDLLAGHGVKEIGAVCPSR